MRVAAVDLGTNSFLCLIADTIENGINVVSDVCRVVRLGENVNKTKMFSPSALMRAKNALTEFKEEIDKYSPDKIIATATSAARDVKNSSDLKKICDDLNLPLHIISGDKEAELSFLGAMSSMGNWENQAMAVVDVGGGSTEIIHHEPGKKLYGKSYDVGCVRLTEMFIDSEVITESQIDAIENYARTKMQKGGQFNPKMIIAVAGTPVTLACISKGTVFSEQMVEGTVLKLDKIRELKYRLAKIPLPERSKIPGLDPLRADVIVAGACLLDVALTLFNRQELVVSTRGLRFGVALKAREFV